MGVNIPPKTKAKTEQSQTTTETPAKVRIEVTGKFGRYHHGGVLYEKGVAYECTPAQAQALLAVEEEGVRPFAIFREKKKILPKTEGGTPVKPLPTPETQATEEKAATTETKIEIGTPEENAEIEALAADDAEDGKVETV